MQRIHHVRLHAAALLAVSSVASALADDAVEPRRGDHPAVVVQRLQRSAGYDWASKFYPHPAGLRLAATPPAEAEAPAAAAAGAAPTATRLAGHDAGSARR